MVWMKLNKTTDIRCLKLVQSVSEMLGFLQAETWEIHPFHKIMENYQTTFK